MRECRGTIVGVARDPTGWTRVAIIPEGGVAPTWRRLSGLGLVPYIDRGPVAARVAMDEESIVILSVVPPRAPARTESEPRRWFPRNTDGSIARRIVAK